MSTRISSPASRAIEVGTRLLLPKPSPVASPAVKRGTPRAEPETQGERVAAPGYERWGCRTMHNPAYEKPDRASC